ncbi:heterokaryon incompatibility protein-domain-containing protein [Echria macrotheca]|uniref:Heterokaryon incompatibility protein-domain-containing protein n=1 Tax=Echria macrotheca TaxID=438768 RepID=A0AAJ0F7G5_9PEZI|nr:heterokaryon incompatibility protein-domain-containing protein [Echria macrotheca]
MVLAELERGEFRLLNLEPAPDFASPIAVRLSTHRFDSGETYEALSYVWGDPNDTVLISVDLVLVPVTRNLAAALRHLRHTRDTKVIWADALCINQANTEERNHQVKYMGEIYRCADLVRIWLGESDHETASAVKLLWQCLKPHLCTTKGLDVDIPLGRSLIESRQAHGMQFALAFVDDPEGCLAMTNILKRPYWRRMWIFQEVVLAEEAIVQCGHFAISWRVFECLDAAAEDPHIWLPVQAKHPYILQLREALFNICHLFMTPQDASVPDNVLQPTRSLQSADPRDKIYALVGVWKQSAETLKLLGLDEDSAIDYSKSVREVYTSFAVRIIEANQNLAPLLTAGIWSRGPDLNIPSWVPDLRGATGSDIRLLAGYHVGHFNASEGQPGHYAVPSNISPTGSLILGVKGVVIDTITEVIVPTSKTNALSPITSLGSIEPHPSGMSQIHAFFSTTIFEHKDFLVGKTEDETELNRDWMKRLAFGFCRELEDLNNNLPSGSQIDVLDFLERHTLNDLDPQGGVPLAAEYLAMRSNQQEMEAFRTEYLYRCGHVAGGTIPPFFIAEGKHIGTGPPECQAGDYVAVLLGCPTPVVLRKAEGVQTLARYILVGPCYLYGMMNGEAFQENREVKKMYLI